MVHLPTGELIEYQPVSSLEIEFIIREIGDRLEAAVKVIDQLQRARYDAEADYSKAFETAKLTSKYELFSDRRAAAILECLPLQRELNEAKAKLHHAENLQEALKSKLMGYQNINKVNGAAYSVGGIGR
ncbi:MAG TPA: hypothetical protein VGI56_09925 [Galbitalea sp.]